MMHQCTDLPLSKHKKKKSFVKPRPPSQKNDTSDRKHSYKKSFDAKNVYKDKERCQKCEDSNHKDFQCPAKKFQCKSCHKYGHFTTLLLSKETHFIQAKEAKGLYVAKQELFMLVTNYYAATQKIAHPAMIHSVCK